MQSAVINRLLIVGATTLVAALVASSADAEEPSWVDARQVGPFIVQATIPLTEYENFLPELPALERELVRTLAIPPVRNPIYIYLFADAAEHRDYIQQHHPDVPYRRALYIREAGQAGVYAYHHPGTQVDLRHECTHAVLHSGLVDVPLWLDEGLAEYFEMPDGQRAFDHPHFDYLRWNMRLGLIRTTEALEEHRELEDMEAVDYRYAWAWVHFMLHGPPEAHEALVGFLSDARREVPAEPISDRLERSVPGSTARMVQHFKYWHR